jgi:hypothetical protein
MDFKFERKGGEIKSMPSTNYSRFIRFLQEELLLSPDSIAIAERTGGANDGHLPMILWQYGLVTIEELERIYDWLETI